MPPLSAAESESAVMVTLPDVLVTSPAASIAMSLSAVTVMNPVFERIPSLMTRFESTPVAARVMVPVPAVETALVTAPPLSTVSVPPAVIEIFPAVAC